MVGEAERIPHPHLTNHPLEVIPPFALPIADPHIASEARAGANHHIGGPTVLVEFGGWRLLTDPTFDAAGTGSTKTTGPAIAAGEVGPIDAVADLEIAELGGEVAELTIFEGASSGLLSDEDIGEAAGALEPGTSAALLVFENTWAAPFAAAVHRSGGQLAVSAGTATAVSGRVSRRQNPKWAQQEGVQQPQKAAPPAPAPAAPAGGESSMIDQLKQLGELKTRGILTAEEFAAQKTKLLG